MCAGLLQGSNQLCRCWNMLPYPQLFDSWVIWFMRTAKIQLLISHKLSIQSFHPMPGYEGLWWTERAEEGVIWPWNELGFSKRNQKERKNKGCNTSGRCRTSDSWNWTVIHRQAWEHLVQVHWLSQSSNCLFDLDFLSHASGEADCGWKEIVLFASFYKSVNITERKYLISAWEILDVCTDFSEDFIRAEQAKLVLRNDNTDLIETSIAEEEQKWLSVLFWEKTDHEIPEDLGFRKYLGVSLQNYEWNGKELREQILFLSNHHANSSGQSSFLCVASQGHHNAAIYIYFPSGFSTQHGWQRAHIWQHTTVLISNLRFPNWVYGSWKQTTI